ncbi:hypothetical protein [Gillisia limnaea]|uniref:Lipoprotein n=1 Tax=Gillisia limnaea (strain DSM 15749 / LMG 21470 / R-8282) TaxID=865937 RepID=H2BVL6_GILLR|nr:hypothetical protein [Gillisia limnaea]EHQ03972.1 hypothetical protein Gilli_3371 [Gillisia limnaea DSM 15749]
MKNTYKIISGILFLTFGFYSCSTENDEVPKENALEIELAIENKGVFEIESNTYIFKETGETVKFIAEDRAFDFSFLNELNFDVEKIDAKHAGEEVIITNSETAEFIRFFHFKELNSTSLKFDIELSNGQVFRSVIYKFKKDVTQKWHEEFSVAINSSVLGAVIELSQYELGAECGAAIAECARSGGRPKVTMTKTNGWFAAPDACQIECR